VVSPAAQSRQEICEQRVAQTRIIEFFDGVLKERGKATD
jgi:hypothetical protein